MNRVLVTGATGFVGRALIPRLLGADCRVRCAVRWFPADLPAGDLETVAVGEIGPGTDWSPALDGVDGVVHLAARVHVMADAAADPLSEYRRVNVEGTRGLAEAAVRAGVSRLVFVSSIKVSGDRTTSAPFRESDPPAPADPYGVSKWEAERVLAEVCAGSETTYTVLRPPLVYGPGVKANFLRLLRAVDRGVPLPLGAARNRRSMIYVGNLAAAILESLRHPAAADREFLVGDGPALTPPELVRAIARALNRRPRLLPIPPRLLRAGAAAVGRRDAASRLLDSLEVDSSAIQGALEWVPAFGLEEGLAITAEWYRGQR